MRLFYKLVKKTKSGHSVSTFGEDKWDSCENVGRGRRSKVDRGLVVVSASSEKAKNTRRKMC